MFSPPNLKEEILDVLAPVSIILVPTVLDPMVGKLAMNTWQGLVPPRLHFSLRMKTLPSSNSLPSPSLKI